MKILMVANVPNSWTGGAARIMHYLRREQTALGHRVDLLFAEDVPNPLKWCGLTGVTYPWLMLLSMRRLARIHGPYDLVNIHTLEGAAYVWMRSLFKGLPPCVITSYGADELRWAVELEEARLGLKPLRAWTQFFYDRFMIRPSRYAIRHATHVITAARSEEAFFVHTYGVDPQRITVIPNGVAEEFFIARDYGRGPTALLFLGGWEWRKGIRYLVDAFSQVAEQSPHLTLSLVGTGAPTDPVKRAFPRSLHERVRVIPHVAAAELPAVYAQHDIFVFPSLFESMSLVVPEAMASGMPVVTTRTCGMPDIVRDGVSGFLVPPRDARALAARIVTLLNDPSLRERLGRAAQVTARELTWDRIAQQTLRVYEPLGRRSP